MLLAFRRVSLLTVAAAALWGADYRGEVRANGLPLPGVTVTAKHAETTLLMTTDEQGAFSLSGVTEGEWSIELRMLGFTPVTRSVSLPGAASAWDMQVMPKDQLLATLNPTRTPQPTNSPMRRPAPQSATNGNDPGFQRLSVNQAAATSALAADTGIRTEEVADLNQSAANSFLVQGSVSSALSLPQQNDWGFGHSPMGMEGMAPGIGMSGGMPVGGPGGMNQSTDGPAAAPQNIGPGLRGPGGPGGPGGPAGPGGFRGGPGGPGMGREGLGGPGGGFGGGFGGREGMRGRPGGRPEWQGRRDAMAFGNNRRNPRNQYNGMGMFSLNNSIWDARTYSVTGAAVDKPDYWSARGGMMFGGPLRIPRLITPDKGIMFTFDLHFSRSQTGTVSNPVNMPTALERSGDFSQTQVGGVPVTIIDPATRAPFPGNIIPASRISSTASSLLSFYPQPNLPLAARNYQTSWNGTSNSHSVGTRVSNIRIGNKDRLNANFNYQGSNSSSPNLFAFEDSGSGRGLNTGLQWSHSFRSRLINTANVSFSRMRQQTLPYFAYSRNVAAELGIGGTSQDPMNWGPPNLGFTNYATLSDGNFSLMRNQTAAIGDSLLVVHGQHNTAFGASFRRMQFNQLADTNGRGTWTFNGQMTAEPGQAKTGYDLADFLLGLPTTASIRYGNADKYFRNSGFDLFANDDWRIHPKFTLNYGLRWDYTTPITELFNRLVNLAIGPSFITATPVQPGTSGWTASLLNPDRNNFSPRLGFAWRPFTHRSMVVRGGYGAYYNTSVYNVIASNMAQQPPFAQVVNSSTSLLNPLTFLTGFVLPSNLLASSTYAIDPNYRVGYAQTWSISVQHDLPFSMFGTVGYLATKGTRLDQQFLPNSVAPGSVPNLLLPQGYLYEMSNGNSIYHAAQLQLNRRFRSGLGANLSYQFSKSIDNAGTGGRGQAGTPVAQNWLDYSAERGLSSFDSRHNLSVMGQYSTGMGRAGGTLASGWKGGLLKDWTVSAMLTLRSGNPFTAIVGGSQSQVRGTAVSNTLRANSTGLPVNVDGMLFNTAAFAVPLPGEWGTAGRNTIPGPTALFLNGGIGRVLRLGERRTIDLQMQAQNVLNHAVISGWGTVLGSNNYGLATNAAQMRRLSLNLRFRF